MGATASCQHFETSMLMTGRSQDALLVVLIASPAVAGDCVHHCKSRVPLAAALPTAVEDAPLKCTVNYFRRAGNGTHCQSELEVVRVDKLDARFLLLWSQL
eukprot:61295-Amphidinium_carterae.1